MPEGFRYCEFGDIASLEAQLDATVAAVMLESIQGEGGVAVLGHRHIALPHMEEYVLRLHDQVPLRSKAQESS
jgi:hypothetical protein